jgi:K+-transporting ATPase ATPase C chain
MTDFKQLLDTPPNAPSTDTATLKFVRSIRPALTSVILLTFITGCLFPVGLLGLGRAFFPQQAGGSLVSRNGVVVGSRLIGQAFTRAEYFHSRPSAAGGGYDGRASSGTNLGPSNPKLIEAVRQSAHDYRTSNGLGSDAPVPVDAVTNSGSGLDPHISPEDAALQARRVAKARGLSEDAVRRLLARHTQGRQLGFLGAPRVSVLELNLALDAAAPLPPN